MKKGLLIIALMLAGLVYAHAETIVLRTGARVKGTIVFQNEEVVIIRDAEGARFQYPKSEVEQIVNSEELIVKSEGEENSRPRDVEASNEEEITISKKVTIALEAGVGYAVIPGKKGGGIGYEVDLLVGSHHIGDRHIFIGGGLGFHGAIVDKTYNFLPIQVALRMPLLEQKHAPVFGVGLGYGIALSKAYRGGIYAGLDFGYRYQINPKTALAVMAFAHFQHANIRVMEEVGGSAMVDPRNGFSHYADRVLVNSGIKFVLNF